MAVFIETLVDCTEMKRSLRNTHRVIWISFVIALPLILAIAWNVAPKASAGAQSLSGLDDRLKCAKSPRFEISTEIAAYTLAHADCSNNVRVELHSVVRLPQLAIYVSRDSISSETQSLLNPIAYFDGKQVIELAVPKNMITRSFFILIADIVKHKPVDQIKIVIR